jgi:hypothetical protein
MPAFPNSRHRSNGNPARYREPETGVDPAPAIRELPPARGAIFCCAGHGSPKGPCPRIPEHGIQRFGKARRSAVRAGRRHPGSARRDARRTPTNRSFTPLAAGGLSNYRHRKAKRRGAFFVQNCRCLGIRQNGVPNLMNRRKLALRGPRCVIRSKQTIGKLFGDQLAD